MSGLQQVFANVPNPNRRRKGVRLMSDHILFAILVVAAAIVLVLYIRRRGKRTKFR